MTTIHQVLKQIPDETERKERIHADLDYLARILVDEYFRRKRLDYPSLPHQEHS